MWLNRLWKSGVGAHRNRTGMGCEGLGMEVLSFPVGYLLGTCAITNLSLLSLKTGFLIVCVCAHGGQRYGILWN